MATVHIDKSGNVTPLFIISAVVDIFGKSSPANYHIMEAIIKNDQIIGYGDMTNNLYPTIEAAREALIKKYRRATA